MFNKHQFFLSLFLINFAIQGAALVRAGFARGAGLSGVARLSLHHNGAQKSLDASLKCFAHAKRWNSVGYVDRINRYSEFALKSVFLGALWIVSYQVGYSLGLRLGKNFYGGGISVQKDKPSSLHSDKQLPVEIKQESTLTLTELLVEYQTLKKSVKKTVEITHNIEHTAVLILDYFVGHYQETKKLLKAGGLDLNELLDCLSVKERLEFCEKVVKAEWFWDFQRKTYIFLLDASFGQLKNEYAQMLCKAAINLKGNPIPGFSDHAYAERKQSLECYAKGTGDKGALLHPYKHKGALGQENHFFW